MFKYLYKRGYIKTFEKYVDKDQLMKEVEELNITEWSALKSYLRSLIWLISPSLWPLNEEELQAAEDIEKKSRELLGKYEEGKS